MTGTPSQPQPSSTTAQPADAEAFPFAGPGGRERIDQFLRQNWNLIASVARRVDGLTEDEHEDLVAYLASYVGTNLAKYDSRRGCKATTFAAHIAKLAIRQWLRDYYHSPRRRNPVFSASPIDDAPEIPVVQDGDALVERLHEIAIRDGRLLGMTEAEAKAVRIVHVYPRERVAEHARRLGIRSITWLSDYRRRARQKIEALLESSTIGELLDALPDPEDVEPIPIQPSQTQIRRQGGRAAMTNF